MQAGPTSDTIAAVATPAGKGGVGIVRVSGDQSESILQSLVPDWPDEAESHKLRHSRIESPEGDLIDEALAVLMRGPETYTGEDVVEFQCHGGPIILERVLNGALDCGARVAEPGEFTKRAYLNGRLDLTQAEAVADLVNASSESAHKMALEHLEGRLGETVREQLEQLTEARTLVEAAIDFAHEEHVYSIESDEISERIESVLSELNRLIDQFQQGRRRREGLKTVIAGRPNAGKSTLFNALHGTDRAIVTEQAGTTRDFLEEPIQIEGVSIRLVDTAGLRETGDQIESIGVERSEQLQARADLIIWVVDRDRPLDEKQRDYLVKLLDGDKAVITVLNKSDCEHALKEQDRDCIQRANRIVETTLLEDAEQREGLDQLREAIAEIGGQLMTGEGVLLSRTRHLESVKKARDALQQAKNSLDRELDHEFIALDLQEAMDALGEITGKVSTEQILGRIFSEFCVGK